MTEEMKRQKKVALAAFVNETTNKRSVIEFANALYCVGILKEPRDHLDKGVNDVIIRVFGVNKVGNKFVQHASLECTLNELEILRNMFNKVL